ncbi:MAG: DNA gyrase inhibitor YacG [Candidatus Poribacteria bacterium]|nr:DNA gyrase inhibitor YacG [Candidatus Poribacteria bacterium]
MKHKCSICGQSFEFSYRKGKDLPPNFPFCSRRCKAIDLKKWLNHEYRISTELANSKFMTEQEREVFARFLIESGEVDELSDEDQK